jgi:SAM-dependent methyltransferase
MRSQLRSIYNFVAVLGINPRQTINSLKGLPFYLSDLRKLKRQEANSHRRFAFGVPFPCLSEKSGESGAAKGVYFHQDLLVARRIYANNPQRHVDVGSRIDGFVAHIAVFREIEVFDIRPLSENIPNIKFVQADLMSEIGGHLANYCDSLSSLHALEHFGLGRYGDPVEYDGYLRGLANLEKILAPGGKFYFSVPIGPQRIEFNAHRVFSIKYLLELFDGKYRIDHFSYIDDDKNLHENSTLADNRVDNNFDCRYGCGIFEMTKL